MDQTNYTNNITVTQVTESIEYTRYRKATKLFALFCVVMTVEIAFILYILNMGGDFQNTLLVSILLGAFFGLAFLSDFLMIAIPVIRMKTMKRGVGTLPVYKVVFQQTRKSFFGSGVSFLVEIPDGSGKVVKTRDMFSPYTPSSFTRTRTYMPTLYADNFRGKEMLVMYNPNRNKVYVLDFADKFSLPADTF